MSGCSITQLTWMARNAPRTPVSPAATLLSAYADRVAMPAQQVRLAKGSACLRSSARQRRASRPHLVTRVEVAGDKKHPGAQWVCCMRG